MGPVASWREVMNTFNIEFPSICMRALLDGYRFKRIQFYNVKLSLLISPIVPVFIICLSHSVSISLSLSIFLSLFLFLSLHHSFYLFHSLTLSFSFAFQVLVEWNTRRDTSLAISIGRAVIISLPCHS